jgi:hypothetical protein
VFGPAKGAQILQHTPSPPKATTDLLALNFVCTMPNRLTVAHSYFKLSKKTQTKQNDTSKTYKMTLASIY